MEELEILNNFITKVSENLINIEPEIIKIIDESFWDLI